MNSKTGNPKQEKEIELHPDAWERFERAVTAAAKSGPKHRVAAKPKAKKKAAIRKKK
jgi:hypothetical protein